MINVIGHKKIFLYASGILVLLSITGIVFFGFRPGIDFVGGTLWELKFEKQITRGELAEFFQSKLGLTEAIIIEESNAAFLIRSKEMSEADREQYWNQINAQLGAAEELRFETIGAAVGRELRGKAITAFILVLLGISLYIAFAFRKVSRPVSSWKYGIITLITLFHDALIPTGLIALLGYLLNVEVDTNFIVAILVVMGFSVHDTIVVFDRIRENLRVIGLLKTDFDALVNTSVNQTMARSINTSLTLILVLIAVYFLGAPTLKYFVLTIAVGTIVGTYSSIFVASPLLTIWRKRGSS